ncbi:MAG: Xaa-Pro peptidase family protein [Candidatus Pacebacteria bacterium]|nr:Xaa-Pro peptidase family protein [Candidatus Paceibacterota bacterium]
MKVKLIIGCSEINSDLYYATKFLAPDDFIYLEKADGKKIIYINAMEFSRAREDARVDEVINSSIYPSKYKSVLHWVVAAGGLTEVVVPEDFPIKYGEILRKARVRIEIKSGIFFEEREIKDEEEIKNIKAAQRVNEKGMKSAIETIRKSKIRKDGKLEYKNKIVTSEFLKEIVDIEFLRGGCKSDVNIVSCGKDSAQPHNMGSGPLRGNEPIIIDLYPRSVKTRYFADMTRTVVRGRASEEIRKIYSTVLSAQRRALESVRAGIKISSLEKNVREQFHGAGYETEHDDKVSQGFIHSLGHGVGLDIHEAPFVGRMNENELKAGNIITIEPGLYFPKIGGVRIEDMVLVKDGGSENLTKFPKTLEI